MNTVTHFEIPSGDIQKTKEFYAGLFDWEFNFMEEMNYMMFTTQKEDGKLASGGILEKQNDQHHVTNYVTVENVDESAKKVEELGGKIVVEKMPVPGMGWFVHFIDIDGNLMALWQNDAEAK
ncbi:MAG: VOC family protein [Ignavibacteriaceae bacterium]|jgi:predicted enzyme related to lactoylglutathione lyase